MPTEFKHLHKWISADPAFGSTDNYVGERPVDWYVCVGRNRDSDTLSECNFKCALKELGGEQDGKVWVFRTGHWACGWVELLLVNESATEQLAIAEDICKRIHDYPILDEDAFSEAEDKERQEAWDSWAKDDFVRDLRKYIEAAQKDPSEPISDADQVVEAIMDNQTFSCLIYRAYESASQDVGSPSTLTVESLLHSLDSGEFSYGPDNAEALELGVILGLAWSHQVFDMIAKALTRQEERHQKNLEALEEMGIK